MESYCFDDVMMLPNISDITTRSSISLDTNIGSNGRKLILKTPLISSPMDTVTESEMAIKMALSGGLGIIHRYNNIDAVVKQVEAVKRYVHYVFNNPYQLNWQCSNKDFDDYLKTISVNTLCLIDNEIRLKGLITSRDINRYNFDKSLNQEKQIHNYMTPVRDLECIYMTLEQFRNVSVFHNLEELDKLMIQARDLMSEFRIQQIPILRSYNISDFNYGDGSDELQYTDELLGMITCRSVDFYFNHRQKACLDDSGRLCVGASVGIRGEYLEHVEKLVKAGCDLICVDVANGHNVHTALAVRSIRNKYPKLVIMSGNVCSAEGFELLANADCDCIRVGIGNGSICSTRLETGIGCGQFTAIKECYRIKKEKHYTSKIICDGGSLGKTGNKVKALAVGADAIIMGRTLASCEESPGSIIYRNGKRVKYFRGMASSMATISKNEKSGEPNAKRANTSITSEGVDGFVELKGSVTELLYQILMGIKSGLSYLGCHNMTQLETLRDEKKIKWVKNTPIGLSESGIRIKTF